MADLNDPATDAPRLRAIEGFAPPAHGRAFFLTAEDGARLRAAFWPARGEPVGTVAILPGRAEFIEKYYECVGELLGRGFAVAALDWRGQGGSIREISDPRKGHVDDFALYGLDLAAFEAQVLAPSAPRPWFGLAHSMGACVALLASRRDASPFERVVASAPLIEIFAVGAARSPRRLAAALDALGLGARYVPGGSPVSAMAKPFVGNPLTSDPVRHARGAELAARWPELTVGSPTVGWVAAAFRALDELAAPDGPRRIATPTLALLAGADRVVSSRAAETFFARAKTGRALILPNARHEILMETDAIRAQFWDAFDAFVPGGRDASSNDAARRSS
jgi:lysophospholipase